VTDVQIAPWTWPVTGQTYEQTAEVTYRQPFLVNDQPDGVPPPTEDREAVLHLVQADGIWRWFFGTDPAWLPALPETC
jgi:hypothetical protein